MKRSLSSLILAIFLIPAITLLPGTKPASAGGGKNTALVLGVTLGVLGTLLAQNQGVFDQNNSSSHNTYKNRSSYPNNQYRSHNQHQVQNRPRYEPWTPQWYDYCFARYRSFDPRNGYYMTRSGEYRFCQ